MQNIFVDEFFFLPQAVQITSIQVRVTIATAHRLSNDPTPLEGLVSSRLRKRIGSDRKIGKKTLIGKNAASVD